MKNFNLSRDFLVYFFRTLELSISKFESFYKDTKFEICQWSILSLLKELNKSFLGKLCCRKCVWKWLCEISQTSIVYVPKQILFKHASLSHEILLSNFILHVLLARKFSFFFIQHKKTRQLIYRKKAQQEIIIHPYQSFEWKVNFTFIYS